MATWTQPTAAERLEILQRTKSAAILGASAHQSCASYFVSPYSLPSAPYRRYFINPRATEFLGQPVYAALTDLPEVPDVVDVFRRHEDLPTVAQEAVDIGAKTLWLQLGSWNEEAADIATQGGLEVIMDRCLKIEQDRKSTRLNLAGFNTGVISSRRQLT